MNRRLEKNGEGCCIGDKRMLPREGEGGALAVVVLLLFLTQTDRRKSKEEAPSKKKKGGQGSHDEKEKSTERWPCSRVSHDEDGFKDMYFIALGFYQGWGTSGGFCCGR
ncbi:hypothetical protein NC652_008289 [Populus alba x Populus x berolinensis]|nr:hypothetical protein NC652_008289 [Populus alba x Populus x berolinensis]